MRLYGVLVLSILLGCGSGDPAPSGMGGAGSTGGRVGTTKDAGDSGAVGAVGAAGGEGGSSAAGGSATGASGVGGTVESAAGASGSGAGTGGVGAAGSAAGGGAGGASSAGGMDGGTIEAPKMCTASFADPCVDNSDCCFGSCRSAQCHPPVRGYGNSCIDNTDCVDMNCNPDPAFGGRRVCSGVTAITLQSGAVCHGVVGETCTQGDCNIVPGQSSGTCPYANGAACTPGVSFCVNPYQCVMDGDGSASGHCR